MPVEVECLLRSVSEIDGRELTTFRIEVPLAVWIDLLTHRAFSRNASSSRAIPMKKWRERALSNPAIPVQLTAHKKGMSSNEPLSQVVDAEVRQAWRQALLKCAEIHEYLEEKGVSKQDGNVLLYQFSHVQGIVSATDYNNFFDLRLNPSAKPDIQILAKKMKETAEAKEVIPMKFGQWHTPLVEQGEGKDIDEEIRISAGRCAAVSYILKDAWDKEKDIARHDTLLASMHLSPFEHQATPFPVPDVICGNYKGWMQYRKLVEPDDLAEEGDHYIYLTAADCKMLMGYTDD